MSRRETARRAVYWLLSELDIPVWRVRMQQKRTLERNNQLKEKFPWVDFDEPTSGRPRRMRKELVYEKSQRRSEADKVEAGRIENSVDVRKGSRVVGEGSDRLGQPGPGEKEVVRYEESQVELRVPRWFDL